MNSPPAPIQSLFTDGWSVDHINAATAGSGAVRTHGWKLRPQPSSSVHEVYWLAVKPLERCPYACHATRVRLCCLLASLVSYWPLANERPAAGKLVASRRNRPLEAKRTPLGTLLPKVSGCLLWRTAQNWRGRTAPIREGLQAALHRRRIFKGRSPRAKQRCIRRVAA